MDKKLEYDVSLGKYTDMVKIGIELFRYREQDLLPNVGAWCRQCARETAKPKYPIYMNGKPAYALKCIKCGSEYPMYQSTFHVRYVGYDMENGGHVNPTHGVMSRVNAMDRKAREYYNDIPKRVESFVRDKFNMSKEEYNQFQEERHKQNQKLAKDMEEYRASIREAIVDHRIQDESTKRKELIAKGVLKYVKNIGLVNTETGEVVKL